MLKKQIKKILKACGYTLYHTKTMPFGCDLKEDIARLSPDLNLRTIFDVERTKDKLPLIIGENFLKPRFFVLNQLVKLLKF